MLAELGRYFERTAARGTPPPRTNGHAWLTGREPIPSVAPEVIGVPLVAAQTIGRRTADLHLLLAASGDDPAFDPEPLTEAGLARLLGDIAAEAAETLALVASADPQSVGHAVDLSAATGALPASIDERLLVAARVADRGWRTRIHGDYHLAQILWAEQDVILLDFGGEPERAVAERRAKRSPLRDVADMVRSFAYAAQAALMAWERQRTDADATGAGAWSDLWERTLSVAFLAAYREGMAGSPAIPQDDDAFARLLDVFVLHKTLSELRHELATRPDWAHIPLKALA
jgi:maltose alpha-D-glucosyltransferase/alpha-amylase